MSTTLSRVLLPDKTNLFIWINTILMVAGLLIWDWKPSAVLLAYFMETIIIGIIHAVKLYTVYKWGKLEMEESRIVKPGLNGIGAILFFLFHYFFFVFVQSIFIFFFMKDLIPTLKNEWNVPQNYYLLLADQDVRIVFIIMAASNMALALSNFFLPQKFNTTTVQRLMMQPYPRIFIQQFVAILSGFFFIFNAGAVIAALFLILLRHITDLYINAAINSKEVKLALIEKFTKGQPKKDAANTKDSFDSFLDN